MKDLEIWFHELLYLFSILFTSSAIGQRLLQRLIDSIDFKEETT